MKEILKRELNKTYLVLSSEDTQYEESYEIEMIVKNEPEGILPLHVLRLDGNLQLFFEISSMQTLKDCSLRTKLSGETIGNLFGSIEQLMREMTNYLLNMECVLLDLEHIYTREGRFYFCYCPWKRKELLVSFREMLEEILGNLDYHDTKGVELAYHLYQNACKGDFSIGEILDEHHNFEEVEKEDAIVSYFSGAESKLEDQRTYASENEEKVKIGIWERIIKFFLKKEKKKLSENDSQTFYEKEIEEEVFGKRRTSALIEESNEYMEKNTMLLQNMPIGFWRLRPLHPGYEEFCITGESFLVGKKKESVDGYIGRDTISRIHSRLMARNGSLYIADSNSTNGTFVNGEVVLPGKDVEIFAGDRILFADVEYECYNSL